MKHLYGAQALQPGTALRRRESGMALIDWNESYSVGVAAMDMQHQKWCAIINRLHEAMMTGKAKDMQKTIMEEMVAYAKTHFKSEESLLQGRTYPELQKQAREHKAFMVKINQLQAKVASGAIVLTVDVMDFLKDWLVNHILVEDKKYGEWFASTWS
jgi:hemerythrin